MPNYDYYCPANERTVEVFHPMSVHLATWGEVCDRAEVDPGATPAQTPVERQVGGGVIMSHSGGEEMPPSGGCGCGSGCGCRPH